ncbi:hypothetical protein Tco_0568095 [Tanacetum coccineum]
MAAIIFTDDFYFALDNDNFDPFYDLDDVEALGKDEESNEGNQHSDGEGQSGGKEEQSKGKYSEDKEDSDYIVDELNDIDKVEVDMEDFHIYVNAEFMGNGNLGRHVVFDDHVDVGVKEEKVEGVKEQQEKAADGSKVMTTFYVGKRFGITKEVRIRAECYGTIPTLGSSQQVGSSQKVGPSQQDGLSQPVKRTKARIINASPVKAKTVKDIIKSKVVVDRIKWTKLYQLICGMGDLLGLDGAFMKGPFPGQLLTAISLDPNNGIYPMAYGLMKLETKIIIEHSRGRAKSNVLLNNVCKVLNGKLVDSRDMPIIRALEYTREYQMRRIVTINRIIANSDGPLTPTATRYWEITSIPCKHSVAGPTQVTATLGPSQVGGGASKPKNVGGGVGRGRGNNAGAGRGRGNNAGGSACRENNAGVGRRNNASVGRGRGNKASGGAGRGKNAKVGAGRGKNAGVGAGRGKKKNAV